MWTLNVEMSWTEKCSWMVVSVFPSQTLEYVLRNCWTWKAQRLRHESEGTECISFINLVFQWWMFKQLVSQKLNVIHFSFPFTHDFAAFTDNHIIMTSPVKIRSLKRKKKNSQFQQYLQFPDSFWKLKLLLRLPYLQRSKEAGFSMSKKFRETA